MRGKFLHNNVIATTLIKALRLRGHRIHLEYPVRRGQRPPAVDIFFQANGFAVAIEIEGDTERIPNDVAKAETLRADLFLIVTPDARAARAAKSALKRLNSNFTVGIRVMPFGAALQWIANNCPFSVRP